MDSGLRKGPEPDPFLALIEDCGPYALRMVTYWIGQPAAAEDILQEAVTKAWSHRAHLDRVDNPRAWFLAIVRRECIDHWRRQKRKPLTVDIGNADRHPESGSSPFDTVDKRVDLTALLLHLSPQDQELLAWRYGMDWSLDTIAHYTGWPLPTVKSRVYRALQVLRRRIHHATPSGE